MFKFHINLYTLRVLKAIDRLANAGMGESDEGTVSGSMGRYKDDLKKYPIRGRISLVVCWMLDKIDPGHCDDTEQAELEKEQCDPDEKENKV